MRDHQDSNMKTNSNECSRQVTLAPDRMKFVKIQTLTTEQEEAPSP